MRINIQTKQNNHINLTQIAQFWILQASKHFCALIALN